MSGTRRRSSAVVPGLRAAALTGAIVLALTACGDGSSDDGEASDDEAEEKASFTVALIEPDITTVAMLAAIETVRAEGYDVDTIELAEPELAIEGLASGEYAFAAEATSPALIAIEQDADIKIVADVVANQWAVYSQEGIASCDELDGRPFGIFSEGAVATAMVREWVGRECSEGVEPEYLVIGGSDVRAQALLSGQIDATALEVSDVVAIEATGTQMHQLVDFKAALSEVHPQTVYANGTFLAEQPEAAQAFISALVDENDKIAEDAQYLIDLVGTHLPDSVDDNLVEIANRYVDAELFDAAALTEENMQGTIDFFTSAGILAEGMTVDDAVDLAFVKAARG